MYICFGKAIYENIKLKETKRKKNTMSLLIVSGPYKYNLWIYIKLKPIIIVMF